MNPKNIALTLAGVLVLVLLFVLINVIGVFFILGLVIIFSVTRFFLKECSSRARGITYGTEIIVVVAIIVGYNYFFSQEERQMAEPALNLSRHMSSAADSLEDKAGAVIEKTLLTNAERSLDSVTNAKQASETMSGINKEIRDLNEGLKEFRQGIDELRGNKKDKIELAHYSKLSSWLPTKESPGWQKILSLAVICLLIGIIAAVVKWQSPAGLAKANNPLLAIGVALILIAAVIALFTLPDIGKEPRGMVFGQELGFFDLPVTGLPLKLLALGVFLLLIEIGAAIVPQRASIARALGVGVLMIAIVLFLFPGVEGKAREIYQKGLEVNLSQVTIPVPKFTTKEAPIIMPSYISSQQEILVSYELDSDWTPWIDTSKWKYWEYWLTDNAEMQFRGESNIYQVNPQYRSFGQKLGVFRFRGRGNVVVKVR